MGNNKITAETEVSTTELACVLGITGRRVRQLAEDGDLDKVEQGRFNLCDSVQRYINLLSRNKMSKEDAKLEKNKRTADVMLKESKARIAKMEADELEGKMHRSEDVAAMTEDLIYTIRSALMALPGRMAVDVSVAESPAEAAELIRKEVYKIMGELGGYRYDPKKYEERVRDRLNWDAMVRDDDDE